MKLRLLLIISVVCLLAGVLGCVSSLNRLPLPSDPGALSRSSAVALASSSVTEKLSPLASGPGVVVLSINIDFSPTKVTLTWFPLADPIVAGYQIGCFPDINHTNLFILPGRTNNALTLTNVIKPGGYSFWAMSYSAAGGVSVASLPVTVSYPVTTMHLAVTNQHYAFQSSTDLLNWSGTFTNQVVTNQQPVKFYRAVTNV